MSSSESESEVDNRKSKAPSLTTQKALIQFLEQGGGLHIPKLVHICNRRPDLFGGRNTPERRGVQAKLQSWKANEDSYELLKEQLGLTHLRNQTVETVEMSSYSSPLSSSKKAGRSSVGGTSSAKKVFLEFDSLGYGKYSIDVTSVSCVVFLMTIGHDDRP
jgi:hypothetical protein